MSDNMQKCINHCLECYNLCHDIFFNHCLVNGGKHLEVAHVKLMADCIQICQVAADFMTRQSESYIAICSICADICEECAASCENIGGDMARCAEACRRCADCCRANCA